ncbi:hypothetical protein LJR022_000144 [Paraburkholderia hospita]|uniref:hypothetical protein n=1 Tax=Paraburkholderia hospita TaxID=169430 RepID=UPI003ECCEFFD
MKSIRYLLLCCSLAAGSAYAQLNIMNALHSAQNLAQQIGGTTSSAQTNVTTAAGAAGRSSAPPYGEYEAPLQARTFANVNFDEHFRCDSKPPRSPVSSVSLRGITLGDVCALPDETLSSPYRSNDFHGQLRGFLIQGSSNALRAAMQSDNVAGGQVSMFDNAEQQVLVGIFTSRKQPSGIARAVIASVQETVCAADASNSLQAGNAFRTALEQKYGKPSLELDIKGALKRHEQLVERAAQQAGQSAAIQDAIARNDLAFRNWANTVPANTVAELVWTTPDGVRVTATRSADGCGNKPAFALAMTPNTDVPKESRFLVRQWAEPLSAFQKSQAQTGPANAPTPKF